MSLYDSTAAGVQSYKVFTEGVVGGSGKFKLYLPSFDRTQLIKTLFPQETFFEQEAYPCNETGAVFKLLERTQLIKTLFSSQ